MLYNTFSVNKYFLTMTMHLAHPALTTAGKRKGKQKFRNAEEARKFRELNESWDNLKKKWDVSAKVKIQRAMKAEPLSYTLAAPPGRSSSTRIPSLSTGEVAATMKATPEYTGSEMIGISQMAKSNAVPVFNSEHIVDIARMRR